MVVADGRPDATGGRRRPERAAGPDRRRDAGGRRRARRPPPRSTSWSTGPARRWPWPPSDLLGGAYGRRVVVIAGKGNNGADGRVAAGLLARRGARVTRGRPRRGRAPSAPTGPGRPGGRRRLRHRVPRRPTTRPAVAAGDAGAGRRHPLGGGRRHRRGRAARAGRRRAPSPSSPPSPACSRATGRAWPAPCRWPTSDCRVGDHRIGLVEDADIAGLAAAPGPGGNKWAAAVLVVAGSPGMTGAAALCAAAAYRAGAGHGPPRRARRRPRPTCRPPRPSGWTLPGGRMGRRRPGGGRPVPGRGGRARARAGPRAPAAQVRWLVARSPGAGGGGRRRADACSAGSTRGRSRPVGARWC